jgi:thiamine-monophosphate kinase
VRTIADIGEDALVHRLTENLPLSADVIVGAGDDCAVLRPFRKGRVILLKTDCVVQGVHFTAATPAKLVGRKALARVLSDIAAMGGTPHHALITLMLPPRTEVRYADKLYQGINALAVKHEVSIVGGETTRGPCVSISVALLGSALEKRFTRRGGARAGDLIFVTGKLGGSLRGHHLKFEPRLVEGRWLAENFSIHAMMDLSDGVAKDLPRMAKAGNVRSFAVESSALPLNKGCNVQQALNDGEDYELLFAISPRDSKPLIKKWSLAFPRVPLTCIGRFLEEGDGDNNFLAGGWDHFKAT